jgi:hypothetical protein
LQQIFNHSEKFGYLEWLGQIRLRAGREQTLDMTTRRIRTYNYDRHVFRLRHGSQTREHFFA